MNDIKITLPLEASTPLELSRRTVEIQLLWGMHFDFFDFSKTKTGYICWYRMPYTRYAEGIADGKK
jgi:hypothetical protein